MEDRRRGTSGGDAREREIRYEKALAHLRASSFGAGQIAEKLSKISALTLTVRKGEFSKEGFARVVSAWKLLHSSIKSFIDALEEVGRETFGEEDR